MPGSVQLIAVSKVQPSSRVEAVLAEGHRLFGENYVQETAAKWPAWRVQYPDVRVHMILADQQGQAGGRAARPGILWELDEQAAGSKDRSLKMQNDFWISSNYYDAVISRLRKKNYTAARLHQATFVLLAIIRNLKPNNFQCSLNALELSDLIEIDKAEMARCLIILEEVGAILRIKGTRPKVISISPMNAFKGDEVSRVAAAESYESATKPQNRPVRRAKAKI